MKSMITSSGLATVLLALLLTPVRGENPDEIVQLLENKYRDLKSLSASFRQKYQNFEQVIEESGVLVIKKPGKMYWEYQEPNRKYFVVNGSKSWFYVPADKQVIVTNLRDDASTPLMLLLGKGDLKADFQVEEETEEKPQTLGNLMLRLVPRTPQGDFSHVLVEVNPASALISRLVVVEPIGATNEYLFTNIEQNRKVSDNTFKLQIPSDVEIVEQ